eukprot:s1337_g12.t1
MAVVKSPQISADAITLRCGPGEAATGAGDTTSAVLGVAQCGRIASTRPLGSLQRLAAAKEAQEERDDQPRKTLVGQLPCCCAGLCKKPWKV